MRIISQNGNVDLPYEKFVFGITKDNKIACCREFVVPPHEIYNGVMAEYSSRKKAVKAMEMLRKSYRLDLAMDLMSEGAKKGFANAKNTKGNADIMGDIGEILTKYKYFQFPKDDEVEV